MRGGIPSAVCLVSRVDEPATHLPTPREIVKMCPDREPLFLELVPDGRGLIDGSADLKDT